MGVQEQSSFDRNARIVLSRLFHLFLVTNASASQFSLQTCPSSVAVTTFTEWSPHRALAVAAQDACLPSCMRCAWASLLGRLQSLRQPLAPPADRGSFDYAAGCTAVQIYIDQHRHEDSERVRLARGRHASHNSFKWSTPWRGGGGSCCYVYGARLYVLCCCCMYGFFGVSTIDMCCNYCQVQQGYYSTWGAHHG